LYSEWIVLVFVKSTVNGSRREKHLTDLHVVMGPLADHLQAKNALNIPTAKAGGF
jgi:hypothetical protein